MSRAPTIKHQRTYPPITTTAGRLRSVIERLSRLLPAPSGPPVKIAVGEVLPGGFESDRQDATLDDLERLCVVGGDGGVTMLAVTWGSLLEPTLSLFLTADRTGSIVTIRADRAALVEECFVVWERVLRLAPLGSGLEVEASAVTSRASAAANAPTSTPRALARPDLVATEPTAIRTARTSPLAAAEPPEVRAANISSRTAIVVGVLGAIATIVAAWLVRRG